MEIFNYWFLLALILLAMEMATGTFYLLMASIATAIGGLAAWLSAGVEWQYILSALTAITGTLILQYWKKTQGNDTNGVNLDIGQPVLVLTWHDNGCARVMYRGTEWDAEPESAELSHDGTFYIKEMRGSSLILTHLKS